MEPSFQETRWWGKERSQTVLAGLRANKENRMHPVDVNVQVLCVAANAGSMCVSYIGSSAAAPALAVFGRRSSDATD